MTSELYCPDEERLGVLRASGDPPAANAIARIEVLPSKRILAVHLLADPGSLDQIRVEIAGGEPVRAIGVWRLTDLPADELGPADNAVLAQITGPARNRTLIVRCDSSGDYSTYRLSLRARLGPPGPPPDFDPILSSHPFSFKVDCPNHLDCAPSDHCEVEPRPSPRIDYLAKDYASFRRLLLDRLSQTAPGWRERNPVDLGVMVVEAIAYAADQLSYYQDAAATEAYLDTARLRSSVRRHARLVDYRLHEGTAARAWICFEVDAGAGEVELAAGTRVLPSALELDASTDPTDNRPLERAVAQGAVIFETLEAGVLRGARNRIPLHDWAAGQCCLPRGATRATLVGKAEELELRRGDVLVLERIAPDGTPISADRQRHAVRLVEDGRPARDRVGRVLPGDERGDLDLVEVRWHEDDALPFALTVTDFVDGEIAASAVARANVVPAEHGLTVREEGLVAPDARRFRPPLSRPDLTHGCPHDPDRARAQPAQAMVSDPAAAVPAIELESEGRRWGPVRDLLRSGPFGHRFVVETESDGRATLRFGNGTHGRRPGPGQVFSARYRVGSGLEGNVGAETLGALYPRLPSDAGAAAPVPPNAITSVRNPLAATGGQGPEPLEKVRLEAPQAFRRQERAVTVEDYASVAERHPGVQRAAATRRWTGSWHTIFVTIDRRGGRGIDPEFEAILRRHLDRYRLAGHDVEVDAPHYAALDLALTVCVDAGYVAADVEQAVRTSVVEYFHPDNFSFGQPVYLSQLIALVMGLDGVERVVANRFQRWREPARGELDAGRIDLGRLEIARLDDDPSEPENGRLELTMRGGA